MSTNEGRAGLADLSAYLRMFSILISAGVSLIRSLDVLEPAIACEALREANRQIAGHIEAGDTLSQAMSRHPGLFTPFLISMVRAGEVGGVLDDTLERAADFYQRQLECRRQRYTALATARVLGKEHEDQYAATVRELEDKLLIQYFLYMFGTMLGAGVPIVQSLEVAAQILPELGGASGASTGFADALREAKANLLANETTITTPLIAAGFPPGVVNLICVGEETGTLDRIALRAGDLLGAEIEGRMQAALGLNEY